MGAATNQVAVSAPCGSQDFMGIVRLAGISA